MLFAAGFALLFAATISSSPSLAHLLEAMRSASGPVWQANLTERSQLVEGGVATIVKTTSLGLRYTEYSCDAALCEGTYFSGDRLYDININGTALPAAKGDAPYVRGLRSVESLHFLSSEFAGNGGRIEDAGSSVVAGVKLRHLIVTDGNATPFDVFVDPETQRVRMFRDVAGNATFEYRDYRTVDDIVTLPFLLLRNGTPVQTYYERDLADEEFAPPRGLIPAFSGPPAPIATDPDAAVPVFPCSLGGVQTTCLLDSGNSGLSISSELAARLNARVVGSFRVSGLGDYRTVVVRAGPLQVGNATFPDANYVELREIHGFGYDVVLGADVLAASSVTLDLGRHTMVLGTGPPAGAVAVPLTFSDFVPVVSVELGSTPTELAVDTGDESTINLSYAFYTAHTNLFTATELRHVDGVGGSAVEVLGTIGSVRVGDLLLRSQRIGATQTMQGTAYGHLGAGFLSNFIVTFDYNGDMVRFSPTPHP
jgi:hypothetical protein